MDYLLLVLLVWQLLLELFRLGLTLRAYCPYTG